MNTQALLRSASKQGLAVTAAEQESEPVEVSAQPVDVVGTASQEAAQRLAEPIAVSGEPVVQELQQSASSAASPMSIVTAA
ncbi:MAG TPA: hypothetical protein VGX25_09615 [Actinophytocola sp.]|uniref:hypothetical protein n=1 Tax=Actinophytocola sp. TaxID=1872138 RepID=UPI002DDDBB94|nr:hypothetical protein [Actinophytocola sp.]HEV2779644.1 hypothetical protein [Actinophytocola sp.]